MGQVRICGSQGGQPPWRPGIPRARDQTSPWIAWPRDARGSAAHLDLYTGNQSPEVERLIEAGASRYPWRYRPHDDFVVLEDPDGNLFCVVQLSAEIESSK